MFLTLVTRKSFEKPGAEGSVLTTPLLAHSELLRHKFIQAMQKYIQVARIPISPISTHQFGGKNDYKSL
ncbi:MAG: hypothetical protein CVU46_07700 [Chloroflexi bacterium HGW-Chloroflexi-8]|jgi:hypothetical protein|nr:MAG: hypothetical protein CVU46_07700 [Chloroflexi bacterium HGW-Chloroflexi-8]